MGIKAPVSGAKRQEKEAKAKAAEEAKKKDQALAFVEINGWFVTRSAESHSVSSL